MQILKPVVFLFLIISPTLTKAQQEVIRWDEKRPLVWSDFKGKLGFGWSASTYSQIDYTYKVLNLDCEYIVTFDINNDFYPKNSMSWSHYNGDDDYLLHHEQLHFDITELFTRKFATALHSAVFTDNFKSEIAEIYNKNWAECEAMQSKYDAESEHSRNSKMQYRWQLFIYLQLKALPRNY
ncbi:hypothetical protein FO440_22000 [Mucilaginibacter corticis]|uniref:DUF922 domain-containing protein n=1 Tax=Mucilaginibacter corticis TaxID=2597670 RepID=A0A556M9E8_9SPHI|nr:hypothetical protein [Mucilaginibacter corticis]TSJ36508.1 hypothetical protein FO440_22000 [Mucilaginibacter corticis]